MILAKYEAIVIGVSAGGMVALSKLLPGLPVDLKVTVVIVQHMAPKGNNYHIDYFNKMISSFVKEAEDKEKIETGTVYFAAADYHLLIERDKTFSYSHEDKVNFSRPSIDVLFESAAKAYGRSLIGIVMTGANSDGAEGLAIIKKYGGLTIVQDPEEAEVPFMPKAALAKGGGDYILDIKGIIKLLN